ncbi:MAG: 3-oxoacyl-[acyl-carrier-protein] reductase [Verrucomicrobiia bacterium]
MRLAGKTAIVTGAGRGIGAAIAKIFAQEGADVACVSRTLANAEKSADEIRALGRKAIAYGVDVANLAESEVVISNILKDFPTVDILVNNAGVTRDKLLMRMSEEDWDTVLNTNLKGAFFWTRAISQVMAKQRSGRLIHVSSVIALRGNAGQANYAASKAGLIGFSKSVAREFAGRSITCNVIAPGFIVSDMTDALPEGIRNKIKETIPLGFFGEPKDIAEAALYLASEAGRYVTGQVLTVDGGMVM